jgi:hypothetical protein
MGCFVAGFVTRPTLVPARDARELLILRDAARGAVLSGDAQEWALGTLRAGERESLAIHVGAPSSVVASLARRVKAPWTLGIDEKVETQANGGSWANGVRLRFLDATGTVLETLDGDNRFGECSLPPIAAFETGAHHARDASIRDLLAYPEEFERKSDEAARRDAPWMTEEQLEASWDVLAHLFGLEVPKKKRER